MRNTSLIMFMLLFTSMTYSQYTPESKYDVKEYILDLNISNTSTIISGNVIVNATILDTTLNVFVIDLINNMGDMFMETDSVKLNEASSTFTHSNNQIFVPLDSELSLNEMISVQIFYHGNGMATYQTFNNGIAVSSYMGKNHSYSSCEAFGSYTWFPSKQKLSDKADSVTFYINTDSTNKSGSLGLLESITPLPEGRVRYKWKTNYPTAYYLISFAVGPYEEQTHYTELPNTEDSLLMYNLLIEDETYYPIHQVALEKTDELIFLFSEKFGIYPFKDEKYGHSVIGEVLEGMEHQTMSLMGLAALDTNMTYMPDLIPYASDRYCWVNAHELAHQWFGNYVTCSSWSHVWLNEGLGTYAEYIAIQNLDSQENAGLWMDKYHTYIKSIPDGSVYIPGNELSPSRNFNGRLSYGKGAAVTHMLRYEINNDSLFFNVLQNYLQTYAFETASTNDFRQVAEETTNMDFEDFFDQWIYGEGFPIFDINWTQSNDTLYIESEQTTSASTPLFKTHFDLKISTESSDTIIRLFQDANSESYKIYFTENISELELDPYKWLLQENSIPTLINNLFLGDFSIYPNPSNGVFVVEGEDIETISIYNVAGELILNQATNASTTTINLTNRARGVYFIRKESSKGAMVKKILLQ